AISVSPNGVTHRAAHAVITMRTELVGNIGAETFAHRFADHVDRAVQRVGAVQNAAGATNHFDGARLLSVGFEQLVNVAVAWRAQRNAIERGLESAAAACTTQYRRTDRDEGFLAVTTADPGARHTSENFIDVGSANGFDVVGAHRENAGRSFAQLAATAISGNYDGLKRVVLCLRRQSSSKRHSHCE